MPFNHPWRCSLASFPDRSTRPPAQFPGQRGLGTRLEGRCKGAAVTLGHATSFGQSIERAGDRLLRLLLIHFQIQLPTWQLVEPPNRCCDALVETLKQHWKVVTPDMKYNMNHQVAGSVQISLLRNIKTIFLKHEPVSVNMNNDHETLMSLTNKPAYYYYYCTTQHMKIKRNLIPIKCFSA